MLIGIMVSVRQWLGRSGFEPRSSQTKDPSPPKWYLMPP